MPQKPDESEKTVTSRQRAEHLLGMTYQDIAAMGTKGVQQVVHELQVHQIELDMQNEELRRVQMELEEARDRYHDLYDFSPAGYVTLDAHGKIVEANLRAAALLGVDGKDLTGESLARFIEQEDQAVFLHHCRTTVMTCLRQTCEVRLRQEAAAGCYIHFESLAFQPKPGVTNMRTAMLDISDRQRAEQELLTQGKKSEAIIESAMDAIITLDDQQRVLLFNRAAESMFGCAASLAIGQTFDRFIPERHRQAHAGHLTAFTGIDRFPRSMRSSGKLVGLRATGDEFPIEASISHVTARRTRRKCCHPGS